MANAKGKQGMRTLQKRISILFLALILSHSVTSEAALNLTKVQVLDPNSIDLIFDGKIQPGQIKTEFVRDNIQLTLEGVSVYPAKVSMLSGGEMTKIFAYQYSPKTVRARFTVKGDALAYSKRLQVRANGKTIHLRVENSSNKKDSVATTQSASERKSPSVETTASQTAAASVPTTASTDLLERVTAAAEKEATPEKKETIKAESKPLGRKESRESKKTLTDGKNLPTPFRSIGVMLFILGLLGLFALFMKKAKNGKANKLSSFIGKLSGKSASKEMIEIIGSHSLGPKKSIMMVKIQNRTLVLGVTEDSMNLITELNASDSDSDDSLDVGDFASSLKKFENDSLPKGPSVQLKSNSKLGDLAAAAMGLGAKKANPTAPRAASASAPAQAVGPSIQAPSLPASSTMGLGATKIAAQNAYSQSAPRTDVRAQIKNRIEGMKQL